MSPRRTRGTNGGRWAGWMTTACVLGCWCLLACPAAAQMAGTDNRGETSAVEAQSPNGDQATPRTNGTSKPARQVSPPDAADLPTEAAEQERELTTTTSAVVAPTGPKNPVSYDLWVLLPALIAILLAIATRQVVAALVVGIFVGAYMMVPCLAADDPYRSLNSLVAGFRLAVERHIFGAVIDAEGGFAHAKIMVFTLVIGFTIGVIGRNGGTTGMVKLVTGETTSRRRGALTAWFAGLVVFFDDYANTMIVGPTMRSVFDRLKLSRAKLAYIVDSTAAPVASIALIGTWIGAEITFIQHGLDTVAEGGAPLLDSQDNVINGMQAFISSLPYRFYPILALVLVFLIALTGRDFGPMKRAERKALSKIEPDPVPAELEETSEAKPPPIWWLGVIPIAVLVAATVGVLIITGRSAAETVPAVSAVAPEAGGLWAWAKEALWEASAIISKADANLSIFYGAMISAMVAVLLTVFARACSTRDAVDAGLEGMARMFPAVVILVLAWALSGVLQDLRLGEVAGAHLEALEFPAKWLPLAVFLCAAVVSFATGTSWGTLGIICPITVTIAASLTKGMDPGEGLTIFYAAVGSVLAGAVFGDHCSPISDTTVLSSIASGCRHEEHVWTQIPYAMVAAIASMGLGDVLCSVLHQPWYYGLGAGVIFLVLVVFIIGRRAVPSFDLADA